MLTLDSRTRELQSFGALGELIKSQATKAKLPEFFAPKFYKDTFEQPLMYISQEFNSVMLYFPSVDKQIRIADMDSSVETPAIIVYDLDNDNDDGQSFNKTLQKYGLVWNDSYWHGAFEEAIRKVIGGEDLYGWAPPAKPDYLDNSGMQSMSSQSDLDSFLAQMGGGEDEDEGEYCPYCGMTHDNCECDPDEEYEEAFCKYCGEELLPDGSCPNCDEDRDLEDLDEDLNEDLDEDE